MGLDPNKIIWDETPKQRTKPDPSKVIWDDEKADESFSLKRMIANIPDDAIETARSTLYPLTNFKEFKQGLYAIATDPEARSKVWQELKNQYSHPLKYAEEKPVQAGMDVAGIASAIGLLGKIPQLGKVGQVASAVGKAGDIMNPASMPGHIVGGTRKLMSKAGVPEKLYESAMKIPPGSVNERTRADVIDTLVRKENLPITKKTHRKMSKAIEKLDRSISTELEYLSTKGETMDVSRIVSRLETLKRTYKNRPDPQPYLDTIDRVIDEYTRHGFANGGKMSLMDAHSLKKGTYREIDDFYMKAQRPETGRVGISNDVEAVAKAEAAKAIREAILSHPEIPGEIRKKMSREAGLMNARKWVERATNRSGNMDVITLSEMAFGILVEKGMAGAVAWKIVSGQGMKSRLANRIAHGSKLLQKTGAVVRPGTLGTFQAGRLAEQAEVPIE